jgi:hypothetical protein
MEEIENIILFLCNKHFGIYKIKNDVKISTHGVTTYLDFITEDNYKNIIIYNKLFHSHYIIILTRSFTHDNTYHRYTKSFNTFGNVITYSETTESLIN